MKIFTGILIEHCRMYNIMNEFDIYTVKTLGNVWNSIRTNNRRNSYQITWVERQFVTSSALCFKMLFECFNHYNIYVHKVLLLFNLYEITRTIITFIVRSKNFLIFFWDLSQIKIPIKSNAISNFNEYISLRAKIPRAL